MLHHLTNCVLLGNPVIDDINPGHFRSDLADDIQNMLTHPVTRYDDSNCDVADSWIALVAKFLWFMPIFRLIYLSRLMG